MWKRARERARRDGVRFTITPEDIVIPAVCPILGCRLKAGKGRGGDDFSPSLDRIVTSRGYVKGNVQVLSRLGNTMKQHATRSQLIKFADWVSRTYGK